MDKMKTIAFSFFSGSIKPDEEVLLNSFLSESSANKAKLDEWEREWVSIGCPSEFTEKALSRINAKIDNKKRNWWHYASVAAAAILACVVAFSIYFETPTEVKYVSYSTGAGEVKRIELNDGTLVILNAMTTLNVPETMEGGRSVTLDGEAWFEVKSDTENPFTVISGLQRIVVTGTKFNVSAYGSDQKFITTLYEGRVNIYIEIDSITLKPREMVVYDLSNRNLSVTSAVDADASAWIQGFIIYDNIPVSDLCMILERKFGVHISVASDSVAQEKVSVSFRNGETLEQITSVLATLTSLTPNYENGKIVLE